MSEQKKVSLKGNAVLNTLKQLLSILFPLITIPYVTRILGPDNYGKINYATSIINYFILACSFGIGNYAIREGARKKADYEKLNAFADEIFSFNVLTMTISYIVLFLCILGISNFQNYTLLLVIQSLTLFFNTVGVDWVNTIFEDYKSLTLRYLFVQIVSICLLFLFVKTKNDYIIYALITVIANAGANVLNFFYIRKYVKVHLIFSKRIFVHFFSMAVFFVNSLAVTIYVNSDVTMLGIMKGDEAVGIYSVATKIYLMVKQLLNAMVLVAIPRLSALIGEGKNEEYEKVSNEIFSSLITILIPAIIGLFMVSGPVIHLISGQEYMSAVGPLKILCFSLIFAVMACFFANCVLLPNKKDMDFLMSTISGSVINVLLNLILIPMFSYNGAAFTTLVAEFTVFSICYLKGRSSLQITWPKKVIISALVGSLLIAIICFSFSLIIHTDIWLIITSVLVSGLAYFIVLVLFKNPVAKEIIRIGNNLMHRFV